MEAELSGDLLVSQRIERPDDDAYERRILRDGAVWERSSSLAHFEEGDMVFERVPLRWREIARVSEAGVARIEAAARGVLDLPDEHAPPGAAAGDAVVTYAVAVDGREHEVRLFNLSAARVPGLAELDMAMQIAVADALSPE